MEGIKEVQGRGRGPAPRGGGAAVNSSARFTPTHSRSGAKQFSCIWRRVRVREAILRAKVSSRPLRWHPWVSRAR